MAKRKGLNEQLEGMSKEFEDDESKPWQRGYKEPAAPKKEPPLRLGYPGNPNKPKPTPAPAGPKPKPTPPPESEGGLNVPGVGRFGGRPKAKPGAAPEDKGYYEADVEYGRLKRRNEELAKRYSRAFDQEKAITPDDEAGARARAKKRTQ